MTTSTALQQTLQRRDVLRYEHRLCDAMSNIIHFNSHAIFFPPSPNKTIAEYLPDEDKILIPLFFHNTFLGVFMARGLESATIPNLLPILPQIATLALENVLLYKHTQFDNATGLATRRALLHSLSNEIECIRETFSQNFTPALPQSNGSTHALHQGASKIPRGGLGLIVFRFAPLQSIESDTAAYLTDKYLQSIAEVLHEHIPEHALAASLDTRSIALLLPGEGRLACTQAIEHILPHLSNVTITAPMTNRLLRCRVFAGYAVYPHDLDAMALRDIDICAHTLIHRATLAADMAKANKNTTGMPYDRILYEGGTIKEVLSLSCARINLGRVMGVREGQHFAAHDSVSRYKGELLIIDVREYDALAEWWHRADMHLDLAKGDALTLLTNRDEQHKPEGIAKASDSLLSYHSMLTHLAMAAPQCDRFALMLIHIPTNTQENTQDSEDIIPKDIFASENLQEIVREHLKNLSTSPLFAISRFSHNACMAFVPLTASHDAVSILPACTQLAENLETRLSVIPAIGIAPWPFLDMQPTDMFDAACQALHYAQLLPYPHIGLYDSLAITIHADALHCQGDIFGAIEAYQRALLIDARNALAWNSLGVCVAGLFQHAEARKHFEEALRHAPEDASIAYNLGAVCQTLKDKEAARHALNTCLALEPEHPYAHIRLGHLALEEDDFNTAYTEYTHTRQLAPQSALPCRYLAEWALRCPTDNHNEAGIDKAREYAHAALVLNPQDVPSLCLMARLYLDGGEDPALATTLARQCVALRPTYAQGWRILARALSIQGKNQEAREAYLRAHALN